MRNSVKEIPSVISVKVTDVILTPLTCAALVNEIFKNLIYQKSQIPYSYNWLENAVKRKRKCLEMKNEEARENLSIERYYRIAAAAYDALENIMKNIKREFLNCEDLIKEVLFLFGSTPLHPKEIFSIKIPRIHTGHKEENHINSTQKHQHKILRNVFLSESWMRALETSVPSTNTYVMLKKLRKNSLESASDFFTHKENYTFPLHTKRCTIQFISENNFSNCCSNLIVYSDFEKTEDNLPEFSNKIEPTEYDESDVAEWYQANLLVKGFKDLFINRVSVSDLW